MNFRNIILLTLGTLRLLTAQGQTAMYPTLQIAGDSVRRIEEVIVTGDRFDHSVIPSQTLSGESLQRLGAHSVADAIRYFSGVQIKDYGGIGGLKTINVRSMGSHHVGVFYDGIQIGNAQNGVVDLGRFSLDNMEAVSLYSGQKSAVFQSAKDFASASSVYLQTRVPFFTGGRSDNFRATVKAGSFGTVNPSVLWERRINENISGSVNAEYLYTTGKYKFSYSKADGYDTTEVRQNGDVRLLRTEAGLFGTVKEGEWKAKVYCYDSERGYPGAAVRGVPGRFVNADRQWDRNTFFQSSFRKKISELYSLQFNGKYAYDYLRYLSDPNDNQAKMYVDNRYRQQEVYFSSANQFSFTDWWTGNISGDFQWNKLNADLENFVYPQRYTALGALATSVKSSWATLQASALFTHVTDKTRGRNTSPGTRNVWTPAVIASVRPFREHELFIRAFYKRIFRMPTLNDNYYTFIGNINLNPEFTTQYNLGLAYRKNYNAGVVRSLGIKIDFYYNEVTDKIVAMPTSNQFRWTMLNLGFVKIRGTDVSGIGVLRLGTVSASARVNYTYQKARDFTDRADDWYGGQIPYIPWHNGSLVLGADYRRWSLNYSFIYTGERYSSRANTEAYRLQPWYTHDLSVSRKLRLRQGVLGLTAEVNNIFNQQYEVVAWYPMPGTNFRFIISFEL